ncbi:hypothetical protein F8388_007201 [Cannabis sativa]|uniref:Cytochrome P450 n=1 Tax=Cannabis sativa TaxID=3483 RepID=A0A7J6EGT9_CANSA|nr:hypothetical protein F8388_007201 [Cannabis sativa]
MWITSVGFGVVGLMVIWVGYWIRKWRNPKCNGILPPGSMGFPLIGETLPLIIPSYSLDIHPFIKTRIQRYGTIFRTSIAGRPVIISADPEFNNFLFQQEGRLVEIWYLDTFSKIFAQEGESRTSAVGAVHKYVRSLFLNHFGVHSLKEKLIPQLEQVVNKSLTSWSTQHSVDIKRVASAMFLDFSAKQILSYDAETSPLRLSEAYSRILNGFMSFPVNIPGTAYHQCLKDQKKVVSMLRDMLKERQNSPELDRGDLLDQIYKDMEKEKFLSEDFIVLLIFGGLFATFESVTAVMTLALSILSEHSSVLEEMITEQEAILKNRENPNSSFTWDEYKSMPFTLHVINESLRLGNVAPGLLRRAIKDIPVKGFTIPAGWTIMLVTSAQQLSPNTFQNPLEFNPWRWKELDSEIISKNFMPFGGGTRQCAGAEYSRVFMATFFHVLLTKFRCNFFPLMWITSVVFGVVGLLVIWVGHWIRKWRNPKCNGILPPGSMGFPLIGETLPLIIPSYSLDIHPFIKTRIQRYGTIFRTSIAGRPVIMSADPEFNNFILQQEGKLVELWYMDTFSKIFAQDGESRTSAVGTVHKYGRNIFLNHFGTKSLKEKLIPQIEQVVNNALTSWSTQDSVDIKRVASAMILEFSAKLVFSYDAETSPINITETYSRIINGFMSFPLNIPGTAYHQCQKDQNKVVSMLKDKLKERKNAPELNHGDLLDQICKDMEKEKFLSEDFIGQLLFGGLFATFESVSTVITLAFLLLPEHHSVLEEMIAEQEAILKSRENTNSSLTWDEYKLMPFTLHVINEILRLGNVTPGLLRKAIKDIPVKGFTIPAGWTILLATSAQQLSPNTFQNPLEFNPWRWKELDSEIISKNFMPFGGGMRQCAGAEYSRVFMATFFHVLLTKYRWTKIKEGTISRNPVLGFGKGIHIKFSKM